MKLALLIFIIINIVIGIILIIKTKKIKKEIIENELNTLREQEEDKYKNIYNLYKKKQRELEHIFQEKQNFYNERFKENEEIIKREEAKKNLILKQKQEIIDKELNEYKIKKQYKTQKEIEDLINEEQLKFKQFLIDLEEEKQLNNEQLEKIKKELEDYRSRRAAVNEAIMREKEIQEKENFYKINISQNDIEDIEVLRTIESKLKNKEALNKLIFDVFISKSMKEMIKRVLNGSAPSGIYKITYLPTGESYIGKSMNIKSRWEQHCKSCFGLGTIAHSSLHTKMARDGIWNFTFEILEEVEKENLSEREKYYIKFYDTVKFGMNEKVG